MSFKIELKNYDIGSQELSNVNVEAATRLSKTFASIVGCQTDCHIAVKNNYELGKVHARRTYMDIEPNEILIINPCCIYSQQKARSLGVKEVLSCLKISHLRDNKYQCRYFSLFNEIHGYFKAYDFNKIIIHNLNNVSNLFVKKTNFTFRPLVLGHDLQGFNNVFELDLETDYILKDMIEVKNIYRSVNNITNANHVNDGNYNNNVPIEINVDLNDLKSDYENFFKQKFVLNKTNEIVNSINCFVISNKSNEVVHLDIIRYFNIFDDEMTDKNEVNLINDDDIKIYNFFTTISNLNTDLIFTEFLDDLRSAKQFKLPGVAAQVISKGVEMGAQVIGDLITNPTKTVEKIKDGVSGVCNFVKSLWPF